MRIEIIIKLTKYFCHSAVENDPKMKEKSVKQFYDSFFSVVWWFDGWCSLYMPWTNYTVANSTLTNNFHIIIPRFLIFPFKHFLWLFANKTFKRSDGIESNNEMNRISYHISCCTVHNTDCNEVNFRVGWRFNWVAGVFLASWNKYALNYRPHHVHT